MISFHPGLSDLNEITSLTSHFPTGRPRHNPSQFDLTSAN